MYQRGISTLGCGACGFDEAVEFVRRHGLDAIELRVIGNSLDLPTMLAERFGSLAGAATSAASLPVRVVALDTSFNLVGATAADRIDLLRFAPWAEALGAKRLRVFDGGKRRYDPTELEEAAETLAWWREQRLTRGWNVDLMVETHDSLLTAREINRFVAASGGVSVLWDAHHTWHKGGEDPSRTWPTIRPAVVQVHVKDSRSGVYVLPGTGDFPMEPLRTLLASEFDGTVSLEWERWWHPTLLPLKNALQSASERQWW